MGEATWPLQQLTFARSLPSPRCTAWALWRTHGCRRGPTRGRSSRFCCQPPEPGFTYSCAPSTRTIRSAATTGGSLRRTTPFCSGSCFSSQGCTAPFFSPCWGEDRSRGPDRSVPRLTPILLGVLFIAIGNVLPRVKPNVAIGIRTSRTLRDRSAWLRVNRVAGYVSVALGIAVLLAGLLIPRGPFMAGSIGAAGIAAIVALAAMTRTRTHESAK